MKLMLLLIILSNNDCSMKLMLIFGIIKLIFGELLVIV